MLMKNFKPKQKSTLKNKKICFVAMNIYPCLTEQQTQDTVGGAELQQVFIGRCLADRGYKVSYVTKDFKQKPIEKIGDIKVFRSYNPNNGIPGLRFFYPYIVKTWKAMKDADADVYYTRCAGNLVGIVGLFCNTYSKKFIFAGAHDKDFSLDLPMLNNAFDKYIYLWALKRADKVIVQSNHQKNELKKNYRLNSVLIKNISLHEPKKTNKKEKEIILWVSTIRSWKRPEWFTRLTDNFPNERFVMIGGIKNDEPDLYENIRKTASIRNNLDFLGFQPLDVTEKYFDQCKVFVNTSVHEGFPNTFLQAWRRGIPVISFVDPDNTITRNNLGICVNTQEELVKALDDTLKAKDDREEAIMVYYTKNHSKQNIDKLENLLAAT